MRYKVEHNLEKLKVEAIKNKNKVLRFLLYVLCLYLYAVVFNLFMAPANILSGGSSGLTILFHNIFNIDTSVMTAIIYIVVLVLSFILLDIRSTLGLVSTTILYPIFVALTANISKLITIDTSNIILMSICAGVGSGMIMGFLFKIGYSPGGLSTISQIIYKYFKISISKSNAIMGVIIIVFALYFIGLNSAFCAIIVIYLTRIFTDKILLGISSNKMFYIITDKESEIKAYIMRYLTHGVTLINCQSKTKKHALMCAIPTKHYYKLEQGIKHIDPKAFFVITDAYEVLGGK